MEGNVIYYPDDGNQSPASDNNSTTNNPGDNLSNDFDEEESEDSYVPDDHHQFGSMMEVRKEDSDKEEKESIEFMEGKDSTYQVEWVDEYNLPNLNILQREDTKLQSESHTWRGVEWSSLVTILREHKEHIGIFLGYDDEEQLPDDFSVNIKYHFELVNEKDETMKFTTGHGVISGPTEHRFVKSQSPTKQRFDRGLFQTFSRQIMKGINANTNTPHNKVRIKTVIEEIFQAAQVPIGYDSKKSTGMVGLENLGATCYLNALLQMLFHINGFRRTVYALPHMDEAFKSSTTLALQSIFKNLQTDLKEVTTKDLTQAFGWTSAEAFQQQDVQEMMRVLLEKLEDKMKDTTADGYIKGLFAGSIRSFIRCVNVEYESKREEDFYDIQLDVKDCKSIYDSFRKYTELEMLDGENQYDAGALGKQDAKKGVTFTKFPPVLTIHLKRFDFDMLTMDFKKIHDYFQFPTRLVLDEFLAEDCPPESRAVPNVYILHSVLVHAGDVGGGHYYAYIRPSKGFKYGSDTKGNMDENKQWYKFNDEQVVQVQRREAVEQCYGRRTASTDIGHYRGLSSAYMLVYIRETEAVDIMHDISSVDIPRDLAERLDAEMMLRKREQWKLQREHDFIVINWVNHSDAKAFQKYTKYQDLFHDKFSGGISGGTFHKIRVTKETTKLGLLLQLAAQNDTHPLEMRLWEVKRDNSQLPFRLVDDVQTEELQSFVKDGEKFFVQEIIQDEEDSSFEPSDHIYSDNREHKHNTNPNPNQLHRHRISCYAEYDELHKEELAWLEELRVKIRTSPTHQFFDDIDPVEGCGIFRGKAILADLRKQDEPAANLLQRKIEILEDRMLRLFQGHMQDIEEGQCLVFVKAYDPFDDLSGAGSSTTGIVGKTDGVSPLGRMIDDASDNEGDDKSHLSMAHSNSDVASEISSPCLKRQQEEEYLPMKFVEHFMMTKTQLLVALAKGVHAKIQEMMGSTTPESTDGVLHRPNPWSDITRYRFHLSDGPTLLRLCDIPSQTLGDLLLDNISGVLIVDLQGYHGSMPPPSLPQDDLYQVASPIAWLRHTISKKIIHAEPIDNNSRILRIMKIGRRARMNSNTVYQKTLSSDVESSMITVSGGHDVKEEGDEKGGKKDLSMGQLGEALLMMQTSLQFSLPSGCPLVTLLTLLADQLCVDPARIAIYLTQNPVSSTQESRLFHSKRFAYPLSYGHPLARGSIYDAYRVGEFLGKSATRPLHMYYNILPFPIWAVKTVDSNKEEIENLRITYRFIEFRVVDERLQFWRKRYIDHLCASSSNQQLSLDTEAYIDEDEHVQTADGSRASPVLASPGPKRRRSMDGDSVAVEGGIPMSVEANRDGSTTTSNVGEIGSIEGLREGLRPIWHSGATEPVNTAEDALDMDPNQLFVKLRKNISHTEICAYLKRAIGVPLNVQELQTHTMGLEAYEEDYSKVHYRLYHDSPWTFPVPVTSDQVDIVETASPPYATINSYSIVLLKINGIGIIESAVCFLTNTPALDQLDISWLECHDKTWVELNPMIVQHITPKDLFYMYNFHKEKQSIIVSVFNFTLLGNQVNVCSIDEFSGPFISYIHEDDTIQDLMKRFGVITGDTEDSWSRCKLALVKDKTPFFITPQKPSIWSILNTECPFYGEQGYALRNISDARRKLISRSQVDRLLPPIFPRIGIQRSVQDIVHSKRRGGNGASIKIV